MRIRINEFETYEINFDKPDIDPSEFNIYVERLLEVRKLITKSQTFGLLQKPITKRTTTKCKWSSNRDLVLYIMQVIYSQQNEETERICKIISREKQSLMKRFSGLRTRHNISCSDIGLTTWKRTDESGNPFDRRIPDFKIMEMPDFFKENVTTTSTN